MILTGENQKYSEKHLFWCHYVHHRSHTDWPGIEPGLYGEILATNPLSHDTALHIVQHPSSWNLQNTTLKPDYVMQTNKIHTFFNLMF